MPAAKLEAGPFYAAWATITVHDTYVGLRINRDCQVLTLEGDAIPGLRCDGNRRPDAASKDLGAVSLRDISRAAPLSKSLPSDF